MKLKDVMRFRRHIRKLPDGCWVWTASKLRGGYGRFTLMVKGHQTSRTAHRVSLELRLGRKLKPRHFALHKCPKRRRHCIRHVYEGTAKQNMADRRADGTVPDTHGENNPRAKLTRRQVRRIQRLPLGKRTGEAKRLAALFGVSQATVSLVRRAKRWRVK